MNPLLALLLSVAMLLGNAFFVGAEFSVMAARRPQLEPSALAGDRRAAQALEAMDRMASVLVTAQLGITVCSLVLGAVAEAALHDVLAPLLGDLGIGERWTDPTALAIALACVGAAHVVIGEMIPKNLSMAGPDTSARLLAPPLLSLTKALGPVNRAMELAAKAILRATGVEPKDEVSASVTVDEVSAIVDESVREGTLPSGVQLVRGAIEFTDKDAADVAVPLAEVETVTREATPGEVERLVARSGFSRFPVADGGELVGYLHLKDVLYADEREYDEPVPPKRVRLLATVRPDDDVEDVLATMQRTGAHLARVVSPAGVVTGVVFLEDVLEELVGEVLDGTRRGSTRAR